MGRRFIPTVSRISSWGWSSGRPVTVSVTVESGPQAVVGKTFSAPVNVETAASILKYAALHEDPPVPVGLYPYPMADHLAWREYDKVFSQTLTRLIYEALTEARASGEAAAQDARSRYLALHEA